MISSKPFSQAVTSKPGLKPGSASKVQAADTDLSSSRKRVKIVAGAVLLAVIVWAGWYFWPNPHVARVQELQAQLFQPGAAFSREQRREMFQEMRKEIQQIPQEQRAKVFENQRQAGRERMKKFFALKTPEEKNAFLDDDIRRMEERRREWQQNRDQNGNVGSQGNQGNPQSPPPTRVQDPEARERRLRNMLDNTTPEDRAMRSAYAQAMNERRQQLGLPPMRGGRGPW